MFLEWNSGISNAIPVPLRYVAWGWEAAGVQEKDGSWVRGSAAPSKAYFDPLVGTNPTYPEWNGIVNQAP
jgi:hypothetical protein